MAKINLTAKILREFLYYDPATGVFTRLKSTGGVRAGATAGSVNSDGYLDIRVCGQLYRSHRLAWLYVHGVWPSGVIDHWNHNRVDNTIKNLRDVSHAVNLQNQEKHRTDSRLGVLGVSTKGKKFTAEIGINGRRQYLGIFETVEQASTAYQTARIANHLGQAF